MKHSQRVTLDAHALIWYYHEESNRELSQKAWAAIKEAEGNGTIYVPIVVLMEIISILEKGKYPIPFDNMLQDLEDNPVYNIIPLTTEVIRVMKNLPGMELHDRAIVATAIITDTELVSIDKKIPEVYKRVIW